VNYVDEPTGNGEFHTSFYSDQFDEELGIWYEVKNKGTQQFNWSVTASEGKIWAKGIVAAEEQISLLEKDLYKSEERVL